jgi:1-acyl-sn-glycerol-3-phosphate acyltransferase
MSAAFPQARMQPLYGVSHYWIRVMFDMFFRGEVIGLEHLPRDGAFLIAANHASHLDPPMIGSQVPRQMSFFARKTLWNSSFASWWLDGVGTIPVDRDGGQDVGALKRVLRALADGRVMILFPEGTRSPDGRLQQPKPGVGFIVCKTQVPVVPARIFGSFEAFGKGSKFPQLGTPLTVVFGEPIPPEVYDDPKAGKERYQIASARIMSRIAQLQAPAERAI